MRLFTVFLILLITTLVSSCKTRNIGSVDNLKSKIPKELKIDTIEQLNFDADKVVTIITAFDTTAHYMYEFWFKEDIPFYKTKYPWVSINHKWLLDVNGDGRKEIIRAQGYEDGIDYVIYGLKDGKETALLYFYPALKDDRYPDQTFWGYPWDIRELDINSKNELMVSLTNNYFSDGNHTIPENQTELPFIYFNGKTTQPAFKKNDLNTPARYTLDEVIKKVCLKSDHLNTSHDASKIIYTVEGDLNKDGIKDKITISENENSTDAFEREHFNLAISIYQGTDAGYKEWASNNNLILAPASNCIAEGFSGIKIKDDFFTIEQNSCSNHLSISSCITFKVIGNEIMLHQYGEEYFDKADHYREIPVKIWTAKDFGEIKFEEVTETFLLKLKS